MIKIQQVLVFTISLIFCTTSLFAQFTWDSAPAEHAVDGIGNVASSIISDSFTPMTHYSRGQWTLSAVPAWCQIDRAYDDPGIDGDDLKGYGLGAGGGYAIDERWMIYCIASYMNINGGLKGNLSGNAYPKISADADYDLYSLLLGGGFDLAGGSRRWSVPVYAGIYMQYYDARISFPRYVNAAPAFTVDIDVTGNGTLFGLTGGIAPSCEILEKIRVTPYYLVMTSFNRPELKGKVTESSGIPVTVTTDLRMERVFASMVGLCLTYMTDGALSFSFNVGGILSSSTGYYNEKFLNGLRMKSVVMAVTYRGGPAQ